MLITERFVVVVYRVQHCRDAMPQLWHIVNHAAQSVVAGCSIGEGGSCSWTRKKYESFWIELRLVMS